MENKKYIEFLERFQAEPPLYETAMSVVMEKGFEAVKAMNEAEFNEALNAERDFMQESVHKLFAAAKDIVGTVTPLMLVALAGNDRYRETYAQTFYGEEAKLAKATCPNCGGNVFKMKLGGGAICCNCGQHISGPEELGRKLGDTEVLASAADVKAMADVAKQELDYILDFIGELEDGFDESVCRTQLKALWTAYCLHNNLDVCTYAYDTKLAAVWEKVCQTCPKDTLPDMWVTFEQFDLYMGTTLNGDDCDEK